MTIKEAQETVDRWIREYGVRYFSELTNMAVLTEEVGELARVMARKYGDQSFKEGEKDNLGEEMADVLWVLLCLANTHPQQEINGIKRYDYGNNINRKRAHRRGPWQV